MDKHLAVFIFSIVMLVSLAACEPALETTRTETQSPIPTAEASLTPIPSPTVALVEIIVFFTDVNQYAAGTPPFEIGVIRQVPATANLPEAALQAFFAGPAAEERAQGLEAITSGFDGLSALVIEDGIARVYLSGKCFSNGATYTVAQPVMKTLLQFAEVAYVKIYDENGETELPEGETNSIPFCLEP